MLVLIATRNAHKVDEIRAILGPQFQCLTLDDFPDAPAVTEDADTFEGNATKKALELARWLTGARAARPRGSGPIESWATELAGEPPALRSAQPLFVLADDSGLEVDALDGAPGVHSARFAAMEGRNEGNSTDDANNSKLLRLLEGVPDETRTGRFRCVIAVVEIRPPSSIHHPRLFSGSCEGRIESSPRGRGGFGYDPLFVPDGFQQSFAELGEETKNKLSHRAKALAGLREWLQQSA